MIQVFLFFILIVLMLGFWGDVIKHDAIEIGSGVANAIGDLPNGVHIVIGIVVMIACITLARRIIKNVIR